MTFLRLNMFVIKVLQLYSLAHSTSDLLLSIATVVRGMSMLWSGTGNATAGMAGSCLLGPYILHTTFRMILCQGESKTMSVLHIIVCSVV